MSQANIAALLHEARNGDLAQRTKAIQQLSRMASPGIPALLYEAIADAHPYIRENAAVALANIPSVQTSTRLVEALVREQDPPRARTHYEGRVVDAIVNSLRRLSGCDFGYDCSHWSEWARSQAPIDLSTE